VDLKDKYRNLQRIGSNLVPKLKPKAKAGAEAEAEGEDGDNA
jgi:hypothetical protein